MTYLGEDACRIQGPLHTGYVTETPIPYLGGCYALSIMTVGVSW